MAVMELWRRRDLEGTVKPEYIDGNFFTQDSVGNLVGVKCYKDGAEVALTGSVTGYCVLPSGETVSVAGTRSGNQASILVPQSALAYTGPLGITLKLIDGNTITTLMSIIVVVYRSKTDTVITPSSQIITDWANQISAALQEVEDASAAQDEKIDDLKSAIDYVSEHTRNLIDGKISGATIDADGKIVRNNDFNMFYAHIESGKTYTLTIPAAQVVHGIFSAVPTVGSIAIDGRKITTNKTFTASATGYIAFRLDSGNENPQIEEGTRATEYIQPLTAVDLVARDAEETLESAISEQTRNLIIGKISGASIDANGEIVVSNDFNMFYAPIEEGKTYTVTTSSSSGFVYGIFTSTPIIGIVSINGRIVTGNHTFTATATGYIAFRMVVGYDYPQVEEGTTATEYVPPKTAVDRVARETGETLTSAMNGGTLGQFLTKNSNDNLDFLWKTVEMPSESQIANSVNSWLDRHPEATTTVQDGAITKDKLNDKLSVIGYNILDYEGNTLNERWDAMKQNFVTWQYKKVLIPYPRAGCSACVKVGNDWKWKLSGPIIFDDACNCIEVEIHGELYATTAITSAILIDDTAKPENIYFTNGVEIRGSRANGNTIGCGIEIRSGARINFDKQVIINDCNYGIIIGGPNQSAPSEAYFDRIQVGFFDTNAILASGNTYPTNIFARHVETACAQQADVDAVVLSNNISRSTIQFVSYGTDIAKDGYTTFDANSVLKIVGGNRDTHNIDIGIVVGVNASFGLYLYGTGGAVYNITANLIQCSPVSATAVYARGCSNVFINNPSRSNKIDVQNCYYSWFGISTLPNALIDRFAGIQTTTMLDTVTSFGSAPSISYKGLGAITIVKTAAGKHVYINDGDENLVIDGQMFIPLVDALPAPTWNLRGKMYRVNDDSGQDIIAVCIRHEGNSYKWYDLIRSRII